MLGVGVLSGMILNLINSGNEAARLRWNDPVVLSTWLMFLLAAGGSGRPSRSTGPLGKAAKWPTSPSPASSSCVIMLAAGLLMDSRHWGRGEGKNAECGMMNDEYSQASASRNSPFITHHSSFTHSPRRPAMLVQVVGCSHHGTSIALRERLAFSHEQVREALDHWRRVFPGVEAVLLSTCNRVEIYAATEHETEPGLDQIAGFLARFHGLDPAEVAEHLYQYSDEAAVQHLFTVASSLDSMVLGETADPRPGERGLPDGHRAGQHRPAAARDVSRRRFAWRGEWPRRRRSTSAASAFPAWRSPISPGRSSSASTTSTPW